MRFGDNSRFLSSVRWSAGLIVTLCAGFAVGPPQQAWAAGTTIVVTSNSPGTGGPECRLRDAIKAANTGALAGGCDGRGGGPYTIELQPDTHYTLNQVDNPGELGSNGLPQVVSDIAINAHGSTIQRAPWLGSEKTFRFFQVKAGAVLRLNDVSLQHGEANHGGAVYNMGTVTVSNSNFTGNRAHCGGVLLNGETGRLLIANSIFSFNDAHE